MRLPCPWVDIWCLKTPAMVTAMITTMVTVIITVATAISTTDTDTIMVTAMTTATFKARTRTTATATPAAADTKHGHGNRTSNSHNQSDGHRTSNSYSHDVSLVKNATATQIAQSPCLCGQADSPSLSLLLPLGKKNSSWGKNGPKTMNRKWKLTTPWTACRSLRYQCPGAYTSRVRLSEGSVSVWLSRGPIHIQIKMAKIKILWPSQ